MSRVDILLVCAVLASALGVVQAQHQARNQIDTLERLKNDARELEDVHSSLAIERSTLADPARVDIVATRDLGLVAPVPERVATLDLAPPVAPLAPTDTPRSVPTPAFVSDTVAFVAPPPKPGGGR